MNSGEAISLLLNIAVGLYLVLFYPRQVKRQLGARGEPPPLFRFLVPAMRVVGYLIIIGTVGYALYRLSGTGA